MEVVQLWWNWRWWLMLLTKTERKGYKGIQWMIILVAIMRKFVIISIYFHRSPCYRDLVQLCGGRMWHWVLCLNALVQICFVYAVCYAYITLLMLWAHAFYDDISAWHHVINTIKWGFWPLFIIGNADFKLNTYVLFCLPQVINIILLLTCNNQLKEILGKVFLYLNKILIIVWFNR